MTKPEKGTRNIRRHETDEADDSRSKKRRPRPRCEEKRITRNWVPSARKNRGPSLCRSQGHKIIQRPGADEKTDAAHEKKRKGEEDPVPGGPGHGTHRPEDDGLDFVPVQEHEEGDEA